MGFVVILIALLVGVLLLGAWTFPGSPTPIVDGVVPDMDSSTRRLLAASLASDVAEIHTDITIAIQKFQSLSDAEIAAWHVGSVNRDDAPVDLDSPDVVREIARTLREAQKAQLGARMAELDNWAVILNNPESLTVRIFETMTQFTDAWQAEKRVIAAASLTGCPSLVPPHISQEA